MMGLMASVPPSETAMLSRCEHPLTPSFEECGTGGDLGDRAGVEVSRTWLGPPALSPSNSSRRELRSLAGAPQNAPLVCAATPDIERTLSPGPAYLEPGRTGVGV